MVVGHVMFSPMTAPFRALSLAPVAVLPEWRRQGIAADLIQAGLAYAGRDWDAVFVLGEPFYYRRFGFDGELSAGFTSPYAGPCFLVKPLRAGLPVLRGRVVHAPAFARLG